MNLELKNMAVDLKQIVGLTVLIAVGGFILSTPSQGTILQNYQWIGLVPIVIGVIYLGIIVRASLT